MRGLLKPQMTFIHWLGKMVADMVQLVEDVEMLKACAEDSSGKFDRLGS